MLKTLPGGPAGHLLPWAKLGLCRRASWHSRPPWEWGEGGWQGCRLVRSEAMPHSQRFLEAGGGRSACHPVPTTPRLGLASRPCPTPLPAPPSQSPGCCPLRNLVASELHNHTHLRAHAAGQTCSLCRWEPESQGGTARPRPHCWTPAEPRLCVGSLLTSGAGGPGRAASPRARAVCSRHQRKAQGQDSPCGARSGSHHVLRGMVWAPSQKGSPRTHGLSCTQACHKPVPSKRREDRTRIRPHVHRK